jgi:hypothetical protein
MKTKGGLFLMSVVFTSLLYAVPAIADLKDDLFAREKAGWTAWGKKEGEWYRGTMTEDAVLVVAGAEPATGRDKMIADTNNHNCEMKSFELTDAKLRQISPDVVILSYVGKQDTTCQGHKLPGKVYSTAVYVRQGGEWRTTSYQETPLE